MTKMTPALSRRRFLQTTMAAAGAAALDASSMHAAPPGTAKYTRYNVMSAGGKKALASYAKGVEAMLKLPADHPQNWFRNAFVHLMDCPHGNWWFYVWHRGYLGYFEQTIRKLSGDPTFAIPYWDWTTLPQIPDGLFEGVLTPQSHAFEPYTANLAVFTSFIQPAMTAVWNGLSPAQRAQVNTRGYKDLPSMWNDVTGNGVSGNIAYATPCGSRYLTRDNPKLDKNTTYDVSSFIVYSGLLPTDFYNTEPTLSFNSSKTASHNTQPGTTTAFSTLEGFPHNKVHNYIGGVGPLDPGPYGNMTNFLSPVDPIFFLHHSNMDRLWDVWTRKQQRLKLPYLPSGADLKTLSDEQFLFYVGDNGAPVGVTHAGDFFHTEKFDYNYEPGFGEKVVESAKSPLLKSAPPTKGLLKGNTASMAVSSASIQSHLAGELGASLMATVTMTRPSGASAAREFDVIVNAPSGVTQVDADSPYYAGTVAFFGNMASMHGMPADATFAVPLPKAPQAFQGLAAVSSAVNVRVVASHGQGGKAPVLKAVTIRAR